MPRSKGPFQGRSMTSHAEGYNLKLAQRIARALVQTDQMAFPAEETLSGRSAAKRFRLSSKTAAPPIEQETCEWLKALGPPEIFMNGCYRLKDQNLRIPCRFC